MGGYARGQMPKNANVICEGSLTIKAGVCVSLPKCSNANFVSPA